MNTNPPVRTAIVRGGDAKRVAAYLPTGYEVVTERDGEVLIAGRDNAGWTLDGYVLPRLASGLMFGTETTPHWCADCDDCPVFEDGDYCADCEGRQEGPTFDDALWVAAGPNPNYVPRPAPATQATPEQVRAMFSGFGWGVTER